MSGLEIAVLVTFGLFFIAHIIIMIMIFKL